MAEHDDDDEHDDGQPKGMWAAMHKEQDANELFGLLAALGGAGARGSSNSTNRNPIPRGRAAESVDWLTELFKFLPAGSSSIGVDSVRVPLTMSFRHSKPHTWYVSSSRRAGVHEAPVHGDSEEVVRRFVMQANEQQALLGLDGQVDIVALYASTQKSGNGRPRTRIEYFDANLLRDFMKNRPTKTDGILQLFAVPTGSKATMVRARYVGGRVAVESRTNVSYVTDLRKTIIERATTFDGDEHCSRVGNVPAASALFNAVSRQLREILRHVDTCIATATPSARRPPTSASTPTRSSTCSSRRSCCCATGRRARRSTRRTSPPRRASRCRSSPTRARSPRTSSAAPSAARSSRRARRRRCRSR